MVSDDMSKSLLKKLIEHRTQQKEEKEVVERRLEKYTTKPLPKLPKRPPPEEKEK